MHAHTAERDGFAGEPIHARIATVLSDRWADHARQHSDRGYATTVDQRAARTCASTSRSSTTHLLAQPRALTVGGDNCFGANYK